MSEDLNKELETGEVTTTPEIPEYLYTDPQVVGYGDDTVQHDIYNMAVLKNIPLEGNLSVLDIGAGRGDLYYHIKNIMPKLNVSYVGYEFNDVLKRVGMNKFMSDNFTDIKMIVGKDFIDAEINEKFDLVTMIGSLNLDYGLPDKPWVLLEKILRKAISVCNGRVVFVLLHSNGGNDQYISYPIPNMTELVLKFNYPFELDYGQYSDVYTLTINTERNRIIETLNAE